MINSLFDQEKKSIDQLSNLGFISLWKKLIHFFENKRNDNNNGDYDNG